MVILHALMQPTLLPLAELPLAGARCRIARIEKKPPAPVQPGLCNTVRRMYHGLPHSYQRPLLRLAWALEIALEPPLSIKTRPGS